MTTRLPAALDAGGWRRYAVRTLGAALRRERAFLIAALPFVAMSFVAGPFVGWQSPVGLVFWYSQTVVMVVMFVGVTWVWRRLRDDLRAYPAAEGYARAWRELRRGMLGDSRLASLAIVAVVLPVVIACFTGWKVRLNHLVPFTWDARLMALDRALHAGRVPSDWLLPLTAVPGLVPATEFLYDIGWAVFIHAVLVWQALGAPTASRTRFLVANALAWPIGGNVVAALMMSAGPCYYDNVVAGANPYARLTSIMRRDGFLAVPLQDRLWQLYEAGNTVTPGIGIAAMPSLHVVTTAFAAFVLWRAGLAARVVGGVVLAFVMFASVLLGWHYALDGYVGVALAGAFWWIASRMDRAFSRA